MSLNEFLDMMYEGREIVFLYNDETYNFELSEHRINIYKLYENRDGEEIFSEPYEQETYIEQITKLLDLPLYNGKTLYDIEGNVTVLSNS
jgi:hypothetical protein